MIQAGASVTAGYSETGRMHDHAGFDSQFLRGCFHRRFNFAYGKIFHTGKSFAHGFKSRLILSGKIFRDAFRMVFEIIVEVESAVSRELIEGIDLAFAGFERSQNVMIREILQLHAARSQRTPRQLLKPIIRQLARIFTVEPMQFVRIKRCVAAHNLVEIENLYHLVDWNFLAIVFRRPAEQAQIIADRLG